MEMGVSRFLFQKKMPISLVKKNWVHKRWSHHARSSHTEDLASKALHRKVTSKIVD